MGEHRYLVTDRIVHQYRDRVLFLSTGKCLGHCRYCFRRMYTSRNEGFAGVDEQKVLFDWLCEHDEVREILVSGGDPMSGTPGELEGLLGGLRAIRPSLLIRLCTRAPIFAPSLFTQDFVRFISSIRPLWVVVHVNHHLELGPEQRNALRSLLDAGISVQSQTVLLKGVNDNARDLSRLFHELVCLGIKPGYLFQCDLAPGTAHFRHPIDEAIAIWKETASRLSGLSLPVFAVDLPDGGGKFPLSCLIKEGRVEGSGTESTLLARGLDGKVYRYKS